MARYINPSFGILLVQKSTNDAIHTDLKVLCLYMVTYMAFEEIFCSFYFCEAFPLKFNLYLSLFTSIMFWVALFIQNSPGVGIFEGVFTSMIVTATYMKNEA